MDGERSEGVLNMAASTRVLPIMDVSISGAFRAQLMMTIVSGRELVPILDKKNQFRIRWLLLHLLSECC